MSNLNFKVRLEVLFQDRMEKIQSGEIELKVYNQLDEYILEDALIALNNSEFVEAVYNNFKDVTVEVNIMSYASFLCDSYRATLED